MAVPRLFVHDHFRTTRRFFLSTLLLAGGAASCRRFSRSRNEPAKPALRRISVVTTTPIVADLARRIAGDAAKVSCLLSHGEGLSKLTRDGPTEARLLTADAIVFVGLHAEGVLEDSFKRASEAKLKLCDLGAALPPAALISHPEMAERTDLHVWMDPDLWRLAVDAVVASLVKLQPARAAEIETRGHTVRFDIKNLGDYLRQISAIVPAENRRLQTLNSGLHYLGRFLGIVVEHAKPIRDSADTRKLEQLQLDTLRPQGERMIARSEPRDLSTYEGLLSYATDLMILAIE